MYKLETQGHDRWRCSELYAPSNRMMGINEHPEPAITTGSSSPVTHRGHGVLLNTRLRWLMLNNRPRLFLAVNWRHHSVKNSKGYALQYANPIVNPREYSIRGQDDEIAQWTRRFLLFGSWYCDASRGKVKAISCSFFNRYNQRWASIILRMSFYYYSL